MITLLIIYIILAVVTYGNSFAYWQRKYPRLAEEQYWDDVSRSAAYGIMAPVFLPIMLLDGSARYGIKFW